MSSFEGHQLRYARLVLSALKQQATTVNLALFF